MQAVAPVLGVVFVTWTLKPERGLSFIASAFSTTLTSRSILGVKKTTLSTLEYIYPSLPSEEAGLLCPVFPVTGGRGGGAPSCPIPRGSYASFTSLFLYFPLQPQPHKSQPARKLPPKKDMKEQEKEGSDSKESPKTKSDESGEEKNGDEDCQRGGQKKKGE